MHNELVHVKQELDSTKLIIEYLKKQIEIHHITNGSIENLLVMAQKLNLTKDELDQYKDKLARIQDIADSLPSSTNARTVYLTNLSQSNGTFIYLFRLEFY